VLPSPKFHDQLVMLPVERSSNVNDSPTMTDAPSRGVKFATIPSSVAFQEVSGVCAGGWVRGTYGVPGMEPPPRSAGPSGP
jgi:hypothetical protein